MNAFALKIAYWNANSVQNKHLEIVDFVNKYTIDILLISETYLKSHLNFYIPNYKVYRLDRFAGTKGGVAIIIKANIKHKLMNSLNLKVVEGLAISVQTPRGYIVLISAYSVSQLIL